MIKLTQRKPPPRPQWATEIPARTGKTFKIHNTLGHAKQAVLQRVGRKWDVNVPYYERPVVFHDAVKMWRWVDNDWQLVFSADAGDLFEQAPWHANPHWGKD